jgi:predicted RNase H-like nuclease
MTTILGIDAAWTAGEPSGVALVRQDGTRWRCLATAPSYAAFVGLADGRTPDWTRTGMGWVPNAERLLDAASKLAGEPATLVTVDMPVSTTAILGRRTADREVSRAFGAQWCSAHSPGPDRPGLLGAEFSRRFSEAGYRLATAATPAGIPNRLVEVYPHPALLALLQRDRRVPYKVSKTSSYWKGTPVKERIDRLLNEFTAIRRGLATHIDDIAIALPSAETVKTLASLKPFEDALDALVCCWVGCRYLEGRSYPLGDETAAVWCPRA